MSIYFGTDGIRGEVNKELNFEVCYKCGNALSNIKENVKIVLGRDTRKSGDLIALSFSCGVVMGGGNIIDVGVIPTAGIAYLVKKLKFDYGVVISASHNPAEYNGIKIFDCNGNKIGVQEENLIEKYFIHNNIANFKKVGTYCQKRYMTRQYVNFLRNSSKSLNGVKIALDCSNGASGSIAPKLFRELGAKVVALNCSNNGLKINDNCGSLHPEGLSEAVVKYKCHIGFAFDGDSDRVIAVDEKGKLVDGDIITYILGCYFKKKNSLKNNGVVGTTQTNMGIIKALKKEGIDFYASDVGDKYVIELMKDKNLEIGGEQSGHIIIGRYSDTGDGVLCAIVLANILKEEKRNFSNLAHVELMPQANKNIVVYDKLRIINADELKQEINECENMIRDGRILVRASGTESKIRVMVESCDELQNTKVLDRIVRKIEQINNKY